MASRAPQTIVVVSHTHWDREWYQPVGVMRQRLAALIDALLDAPDGLPFLLDGQAIVLDDYRSVRPERMAELSAALSEARLEAGPWYVLPDLLIPSGEALVRNLLEGVRTVRELGGAPPPVLYSPDAFGHSAAGPALAAGFGLGVAVVWRGFGGPPHPMSTVVRWTHPSGAATLLYHLPQDGYETGSSLPDSLPAATLRWRALRDAMLHRNPLSVSLLPNGADHHARQRGRVAAIEALATAAAPDVVEADSLTGFARRLTRAAADAKLADVSGELRDSSGWTWSLQGTFATRAHQKRTNAQIERLLARDTEPWAALAWFCIGVRHDTLRAAWKTLLSTHPHDTLCGCSIDDVGHAADARWADARHQATGIRSDALRRLVACDSAEQRDREAQWRATLVIRNPAARARGGAVQVQLIDAVVNDPVGPGSASRTGARMAPPPGPPEWTGDDRLQLLHRSRQFDRVESPLHYPRNAVVRVSEMMAWIPPIGGYAIHPVPLSNLSSITQPVPTALRVRATETELVGASWRLSRALQGVNATHAATGARLHSLGWLDSVTDAGDTYTPSLRGQPVVGHWSAPQLQARGPIRAAWELRTQLERPRVAISSAVEPTSRELPARDHVTVSATATVSLDAGADRIDIVISGENTAGDHRLRWVLPLPGSIHTNQLFADAAFGAVRREYSERDVRDWSAEQRLETGPLHRWLYLTGESYGLGLISDGLAEYELLPNGHLAITLLRAVGELSRRDLPERPGHAGWPATTRAAQSFGPFDARFALVALPHDHDAALAVLEASADDVLAPVAGETWRGVADELPAFGGLTLEGDGLAFSAAKPSDDGEWLVLRCINQRGTAVRGVWHLPRPAQEVRHARLDETPGQALTGAGPRIRFDAPPYGIVTLLVR